MWSTAVTSTRVVPAVPTAFSKPCSDNLSMQAGVLAACLLRFDGIISCGVKELSKVVDNFFSSFALAYTFLPVGRASQCRSAGLVVEGRNNKTILSPSPLLFNFRT